MSNQTTPDDGNSVQGFPTWLASLMIKRGGDLLPRFAFYYRKLAGRPRAWRRRLRRQLAVTVTGAALLLAMSGVAAQVEPAATENVITVVNGEVRVLSNSKCSLNEAIQNANNTTTGRPHADCAAGNPGDHDTINLPVNGLFNVTTPFVTSTVHGNTGLPWISSGVTINGNGSTIRRTESEVPFRLMAIGPNGNVRLTGITISNGYLSDPPTGQYVSVGSGILNQGQLELYSSTLSGNRIKNQEEEDFFFGGGGIANFGTLTISRSVVVDNIIDFYNYYSVGTADGAGILNTGTLVITGSEITGNVIDAEHSTNGAGISNTGSLSIYLSDVSDNDVEPGAGGGVFSAQGSELMIVDSRIHDNFAWIGSGGGISSNGFATIRGTVVNGNTARGSRHGDVYGEGGGISNGPFGVMTISNTTISDNKAGWAGGGIYNSGDLLLTSATITGNSSGGLGVSCYYSQGTPPNTQIANSLISGNEGLYYQGRTYGDFEIGVIQYYSGNCPTILTSLGNNLFGYNGQSRTNGFDISSPSDIVPSGNLASILSPLAANGGATETHALPPGSPAIDRAPNNSCTAAPVNGVDQRGQPRNANGSGGTSSNECDVGAFEAGGSAPPVGAFFISPATNGTVGGVAFAPSDILKFDPAAGWSMYFDGSDVGISKNVSAFEILDNGHILMSFVANQAVPGVGTFAPHDIARFRPTQTGTNTAGTFVWELDGSTRGLTTSAEKIDALGNTPEGYLVLSTVGTASVTRLNGSVQKAQDEDALGYRLDTGSWWLFFDGTVVTGLGVEDVNAMWVNPATGEIFVSILGPFNLGGVTGDGKDIVKLTPNGAGGYTPSLPWDGSAAGLPTTIDGLEMGP